ncbi:MAG: dUTP diphosphatase [Actinomycetota bacterium]|nr:dUTP diphosphatase [Actinomycetota bacterium]
MTEEPIGIRFMKLREGAKTPLRATESATGYDLFACIPAPGSIEIGPDPVRVPTGIAVEAPSGCDMQLRPRSGLNAAGVIGVVGTIDADYRGEIFVTLYTVGSRGAHRVLDGDRIAQLVVSRSLTVRWVQADRLSDTGRGGGGHGSTGR